MKNEEIAINIPETHDEGATKCRQEENVAKVSHSNQSLMKFQKEFCEQNRKKFALKKRE